MDPKTKRRKIVKELLIQSGEHSNLVKYTLDRLDKLGFFTAPASASHHGNYEGGLCDHSIAVARRLNELTAKNKLMWEREGSAIRIGLFHDLCKCDQYIEDSDGCFTYNEGMTLTGHGEKSVMIAATLELLNMEEVCCIRYHMGAYETDTWKAFDAVIKEYPNVLYTHMADMLASKLEV